MRPTFTLRTKYSWIITSADLEIIYTHIVYIYMHIFFNTIIDRSVELASS